WLEGIRADTPPEFGDLLEESISARAPHPLRMTMGDFYALTHEVFFITDFGRRVVPSIICRHKIAALLNNCILAHVASNDLDLLGELLIAHFVVRAEISPA